MVTTFFPPHHFGGDALYVHRLSNALAERGHEVTVVHDPEAFSILGGRPGPAPALAPRVTVEPVRTRWPRVSPLVTYLTGRPGPKSRQLRGVLEGRHFDVIHFHNPSLVGGPEVLRYGHALKLYTLHEHWLVCPMHTLWRYNRELCERPTCIRCTLTYRRPPQLWRDGALVGDRTAAVDLFLAPSRFTMEMHRRRGFTGPMRHLPPFVPAGETGPAPAAPPDRAYFVTVGRLERLKGVHTLIEVFRRYDAADLVIVGGGTLERELRRQAAGLPHVRFTGTLPFSQLGDMYANALAVVVPSVGYETFGLVTLEAFARRTPAIVRDLGGLPEAVVESGGGFVYRNDEELIDALERLRTSAGLRDELGERGHAAYRRRWNADAHLDAYLGIVDELSSTRSPVAAER